MKTKVLFVGDHPYSYSGNGNMMRALLATVDYEAYETTCFGLCSPEISQYVNNLKTAATISMPYGLIAVERQPNSPFRGDKLVALLSTVRFDVVVFVGLDVWSYVPEFEKLGQIRSSTDIKYMGLFPYDTEMLRTDWVDWLRFFDLPCIYSQFGYDMVKEALPKAQYFRPPLADVELYKPITADQRAQARSSLLNGVVDEDVFIFGFFGRNQYRKDLPKVLKALSIVRQKHPKTVLFMNTNLDGVFNIGSLLEDYGLRKGDVLINSKPISEPQMVNLYGAIDCLVNCSLQEGLSWTLLNAMLVGTPVIATATTAQPELVIGAGLLTPCQTIGYLSTFTKYGPSVIETPACVAEDLAEDMLEMVEDKELRKNLSEKGQKRALGWLAGVSALNPVLANLTAKKVQNGVQTVGQKIKAVLFAQHSSAGDVLMSTQCFKGIKERHKGMPLVYMTQHKYQGIVEDNAYVDEIISWDVAKLKKYEIVYNPHGDRILPGGFNNLDVTLYSMYPYFCKVEPDEITISPIRPAIENLSLKKNICIVHTTGGQVEYRTYKHLDLALKGLDLFVIQIGGIEDWPVRCADLDLRGRLTWRETAWVMCDADIVVCVDSFPMHLAGALGKNTVAIFGPAPARVTQPRMQHGAKLVCLEPNKLDVCPSLTSCWGQTGKRPCQSPCINTITPYKVKAAIKQLLGGDV